MHSWHPSLTNQEIRRRYHRQAPGNRQSILDQHQIFYESHFHPEPSCCDDQLAPLVVHLRTDLGLCRASKFAPDEPDDLHTPPQLQMRVHRLLRVFPLPKRLLPLHVMRSQLLESAQAKQAPYLRWFYNRRTSRCENFLLHDR